MVLSQIYLLAPFLLCYVIQLMGQFIDVVCRRHKDALTAGDLTPTRVSIGVFIIGMFGISLGFVLVYFGIHWVHLCINGVSLVFI